MPTDWRPLLDSLGVHWTTSGHNARRGNVSIKCPWCGDDPSEHLQVSESGKGYYCLRHPREHSGGDLLRLLRALVPTNRLNLISLLNDYAVERVIPREEQKPRRVQTDVQLDWSHFRLAAEHPRYLDYLRSRGFDEPEMVCRRYDLRYAPTGRWAARLLFPLTEPDGTLIGWTGRALLGAMHRRYDTHVACDGGPLYLPRAMRAVAHIVEGPLDALKLAVATEQSAISPVALTGMQLDDHRIRRLVEALRPCTHCLITLDSNVNSTAYYPIKFALARELKSLYIGQFRVPTGFDDPGEMSIQELQQWEASSTGELYV